ncbi:MULTISPECIES: mannitol dehydrogenase family protein [Pseudomonas]|uniref:Mannitol dehydrogenase family protein n=1 Tax=Pseudomonas petroselini TaxID=2899822 RepID=A0ABS8R3L4_9PSED|nr:MULTISPECIES: mannitol dehydrogenase family protein [Pseudomonas]MCD7042575.1 mannitol dehydrogenase family protein [Pseudomonas petroselini]MCD7067647.1 mannitol dehydrogenase family protein [Pseudomonas petroselini]MCM2379677.1 mannitol dehydrogenase family protein [Pseudomonas marginalis]MDD2031439.1 mannitol dehydrogenase family protein [Pseudomonas sp. 39167]
MPVVTRLPSTRAAPEIGIVHLGLGAFHRAHQAVYLQRHLNRHGQSDWGLCSANLRSNRTLVDQLRAQDGRYHVAEYRDREQVTLREIGVLRQALYVGEGGHDLELLLQRMAAPQTRIVTLTVTEKGYCLSPATGQLRMEDPAIAHDIAHPQAPRTAPGIVLEALRLRRAAGIAAFTVLCCDNMPDNGQRTRQAVSALAALQDQGLAQWVNEQVAFPGCMVDRIVPAMDGESFTRLEQQLDCHDRAAVVCESFSQWVIEDHFPLGRPDWELEGVQMVADVRPFETMKLRMLNGSHSLLAYVGLLVGHDLVFDAINDADLAHFIERYMTQEAAPTLDMPAGIDLVLYAHDLKARFANDSLQHRLRQIAMDGSQKLPQRWLLGAQQLLDDGRGIACIALGIAAWIHYCTQPLPGGSTQVIDDPLNATFADLAGRFEGASLVGAFLDLDEVFPAVLSARPAFRDAVQGAYGALVRDGMGSLLRTFAAHH